MTRERFEPVGHLPTQRKGGKARERGAALNVHACAALDSPAAMFTSFDISELNSFFFLFNPKFKYYY